MHEDGGRRSSARPWRCRARLRCRYRNSRSSSVSPNDRPCSQPAGTDPSWRAAGECTYGPATQRNAHLAASLPWPRELLCMFGRLRAPAQCISVAPCAGLDGRDRKAPPRVNSTACRPILVTPGLWRMRCGHNAGFANCVRVRIAMASTGIDNRHHTD